MDQSKFNGDPICDCRPILHKYANEDVSLGAWFIGLEVEHIDDRSMCCGTPPGMDSEKWKFWKVHVFWCLPMKHYT